MVQIPPDCQDADKMKKTNTLVCTDNIIVGDILNQWHSYKIPSGKGTSVVVNEYPHGCLSVYKVKIVFYRTSVKSHYAKYFHLDPSSIKQLNTSLWIKEISPY